MTKIESKHKVADRLYNYEKTHSHKFELHSEQLYTGATGALDAQRETNENLLATRMQH
jgi:hypothetical protein